MVKSAESAAHVAPRFCPAGSGRARVEGPCHLGPRPVKTRLVSRRSSQGVVVAAAPRRSMIRVVRSRTVGNTPASGGDSSPTSIVRPSQSMKSDVPRTCSTTQVASRSYRVGPIHPPPVVGPASGVVDHDRSGADRRAQLGEQQRAVLGDRLGEAHHVADLERARRQPVARIRAAAGDEGGDPPRDPADRGEQHDPTEHRHHGTSDRGSKFWYRHLHSVPRECAASDAPEHTTGGGLVVAHGQRIG